MFRQPFQIRSSSEQVADFLRDRIRSGKLRGQMPGVHPLAEELGVHHTTVADALRQLETEGFLKGAGAGKRREILMPQTAGGVRLKVAILLYEPEDIGTQLINELRHQLSRAGHDPVVAATSLVDLKFEVKRLEQVLRETKADAWIVVAGSREVLEWFALQGVATFALFGDRTAEGVAHTGPVKAPLVREIVRRLVKLGHRRIIFLIAEHWRRDQPVATVRAYLDEMELQGLPPGSYNLPDWSHDKRSLQECLTSSFQVTPPTALIVDDSMLMPAVLQFLNQRKLSVPGDVSLLFLDGDPSFKWMEPALSYLEVDRGASIRHAVRWVNRFAKGKDDRRKISTKAKLIEGGTIGPARC